MRTSSSLDGSDSAGVTERFVANEKFLILFRKDVVRYYRCNASYESAYVHHDMRGRKRHEDAVERTDRYCETPGTACRAPASRQSFQIQLVYIITLRQSLVPVRSVRKENSPIWWDDNETGLPSNPDGEAPLDPIATCVVGEIPLGELACSSSAQISKCILFGSHARRSLIPRRNSARLAWMIHRFVRMTVLSLSGGEFPLRRSGSGVRVGMRCVGVIVSMIVAVRVASCVAGLVRRRLDEPRGRIRHRNAKREPLEIEFPRISFRAPWLWTN